MRCSTLGRARRHGYPAPPRDGRPPRYHLYEIPLAIQDRAFTPDGQLLPRQPHLLRRDHRPVRAGHRPLADLEPRVLRQRLHRQRRDVAVPRRRAAALPVPGTQRLQFALLDPRLHEDPRREGLADRLRRRVSARPVDLDTQDGHLLLGPAERADIIVDFTGAALGSHILHNLGPDEPFGGGEPDEDFDSADPETTGRVLQFRVRPRRGSDTSTPPQYLRLPTITHPTGGATRPLALIEKMSQYFEDAPSEARLGVVDGGASSEPATFSDIGWAAPITENPAPGAVETWEFYNTTVDAHPMHIHEVMFAVVNRQPIELTDGNGDMVEHDGEHMGLAMEAPSSSSAIRVHPNPTRAVGRTP